MGTRLKFADVVLDIDEVVALIGRVVYLRDGRELVIGDKAADDLRKFTLPCPELPQEPRDTSTAPRPEAPSRPSTGSAALNDDTFISEDDLKELEALAKRVEDRSEYGGGLILALVNMYRNVKAQPEVNK